MSGKYIIDEDGRPFLFPQSCDHLGFCRDMKINPDTVIGAGFVQISDNRYICYGESISLGIISRGKLDADKLNKYLGGNFL